MVTKHECQLCKEGILERIDGLRREIYVAAGVSTTLTATFITILALLLQRGVI